MKDQRKNRNFRKYKNIDGSFTYVITVDCEKVEVSEAIYREYASSARKMEYAEQDLKRDRILQDANGKAVTDENGLPVILPEREVSLDKLVDEDWEFPSTAPSPEDVFIFDGESEITELHRCISLLNADEIKLIKALYFEGMTERQYAEKLAISKTALHARKIKVL